LGETASRLTAAGDGRFCLSRGSRIMSGRELELEGEAKLNHQLVLIFS